MTETAAHASTDLLIVGAGPTGLAAAVDAIRHGLKVRIVEKHPARLPLSKALVVHARTMEVLERLGCADEVLRVGARFRALHLHARPGTPATRVDLLGLDWGDTRYPFWLSVPQFDVENVLEARLRSVGVDVEWSTSLEALAQDDDGVTATLRSPDGRVVTHRARFIVGADGGRSTVREQIGVSLSRRELGITFALADVTTTSDLAGDEGHVVVSDDGLLWIVPMPAPGVWRLIAQVDDPSEGLDADAWNALVRRRARIDLHIHRVGWSSTFALTSGVSEALRRGRVFLGGDAAHVHSPVGGQGLNTGVQDAHNLIWKLALALGGSLSPTARETLLDSYEVERHPGAVAMVANTERATRLLTSRKPWVRGLLRLLASHVLRFNQVRNRFGRGVGMLDLETGGRPRLPNPPLAHGVRLHDHATSLQPILLTHGDRTWLVRPDLVVARSGELSASTHVRV